MASALSHAVVAVSLGSTVRRPRPPLFWLLGVTCAVLPDIDVIGFRFGIHYSDLLGHRGLTHSLAFAAVVSGLIVAVRRNGQPLTRRGLWLYLFIVGASHGVLDAMTNGGLGVAFFAPFSSTRYFLPLRPIEVSPIGIGAFFSARGIAVLTSEALWIWLPALGLVGVGCALRWRKQSPEA